MSSLGDSGLNLNPLAGAQEEARLRQEAGLDRVETRTPTPNADESLLSDLKTGGLAPLTLDDQERIRQQRLSRSQSAIDAINLKFAQTIADVKEAAVGKAGEIRSEKVRGEGAGTVFGEAPEQQRITTTRELSRLDRDREIAIASAKAEFEKLATDDVQAENARRQGNLTLALQLEDRIQNKAKEGIKTAALVGTSFKDFSAKVDLPSLVKQGGFGSEGALELYYNSQLPKTESSDFKFEKVGDDILAFQFDRKTQDFKRRTDLDVKAPMGGLGKFNSVVTPDGTVLLVPEKIDLTKSLDEQVKIFGKEEQFAKPSGAGGNIAIESSEGTQFFTPNRKLSAREQQIVQAVNDGSVLIKRAKELYEAAAGSEYGGVGAGIASGIKGIFRVGAGTIGLSQAWRDYNNFIESNLAPIAKGIKGEVGNLSEFEQQKAVKAFPTRFSSPQNAETAWRNLDIQLQGHLRPLGRLSTNEMNPAQFDEQ